MSPLYALAVACPQCGAFANIKCLGENGLLMDDAVHARRRRRYRQVHGR